VLTYPMIGNYGANEADKVKRASVVSALIVRELAGFPSNYRCEESFPDF
jgi:carbamoyl-phosphate synthase small subunit